VAREIAQTGATFTGKLTAVDTANRTLMAKTLFETKQFKVADNCAIMINGKPDRNLSDLKPGGELTFRYHDENGSLIVSRISNEPASHQTETTSAQPMSSFPYP
jgi:hypothetical protein